MSYCEHPGMQGNRRMLCNDVHCMLCNFLWDHCLNCEQQSSFPPVLEAIVGFTMRRVHRVDNGKKIELRERLANLVRFDRSLQMLRREVVRAIRQEELELGSVSEERHRLNAKCLKGRKWELRSFINRVCHQVAGNLGYFGPPLLPLNAKSHASDEATTALSHFENTLELPMLDEYLTVQDGEELESGIDAYGEI